MSLDNAFDHIAATHLAGLLDSAMDAIISVDGMQRIVIYNRSAEKIFGHPAAQMIGKPLDLLMPERFRAGHAGHMAQFALTGVTTRRMGDHTAIRGVRASGDEFPIDASISQLDTPQGKLFTVILRDVTERVRSREELAAFAAEASGIREQEKTRIARELHDELAQSLTALKMDTIWLRDHIAATDTTAQDKLASMLSLLDGSVAATRRIAADLRPLLLDDLGLVAAIEWLVQNFGQRSGVACELEIDPDLELQEPHATAAFRIVQEALANVGKHAKASHAWVRIVVEAGHLVLQVSDDGVGFSTAQARKPQSLGLVGQRERAYLLKGDVRVDSAPGQGTRIEARFPMPQR